MALHRKPATHDVIVIGGGAAGLSAALVLGRARRRVAVVDGGHPRNAPAAHMQGFLSRDGMPPLELIAAGRDEVQRYGVEVIEDQVIEVEALEVQAPEVQAPERDALEVEPGFALSLLGGNVLTARRMLIATGAHDELPDIPGARERWGKEFLHCPYCHGWEVRDQPIGVLATQNGSVQHAQLVRQWSDDVVFFSHTQAVAAAERLQLEARGIRIVDGIVARFVTEDDRLSGVELEDGRTVPRTAIFIRPLNVPHADRLLDQLALELDASGFVAVDANGRTSTPGIWAGGNVVDPRAQVIASAGAGNAAAIAINADLVEEDVRNAVRSAGEKD
ncbi:MAG TPA: NAD(P)/FAD-dependent oxidoreductase [Gaiellaceae bacterium]